MISIALRNLFGEKTRFFISVGGVAFSVMLILVIISLYRGWEIKSMQYIRSVDTDLWVTQDGSSDLTSSASIIPLPFLEKIKQIDGVKEVNRFIGRPVQFDLKGKHVNAYLVGYDTEKAVAGPQKIIEGKREPEKQEMVIDRILAQNHKVSLGDYVDIFGRPFKVVGISEGSNMFVFQFSFINQKEAIDIFKMQELSNFYLVKAESGKLDFVKKEINKIEGLDALLKEDFVQKNKRLIDEVFIPIISVLVFISILVGITVIGLTIYTATLEKSREFGVLKALGASNFQVYRIIFEQSLVSGVIGYFCGLGLTYLTLWLIPKYVPVFVTLSLRKDQILVFVIAVLMSILASYTPVRRIVKIDPALVFKS